MPALFLRAAADAAADPDAAAAAAAQAAAIAAATRSFTIELWTLYAIGVSITFLRMYARIVAVGWRNLRADDLLVWIGILFYSAQATLAHHVVNMAQGLANNGMTPEQRADLSPDSEEYRLRVLGSKIQVAGWTTYTFMLLSLKLSLLAFYIRLTQGLGRRYRIRINIGFALVIGTSLAAFIAVLTSCRPFNHNWQINPDPGNECQPAIALPVVWVSFAANVSTDIYLLFIPLPLLWESTLRLVKKIASTIVLGTGIFVLVCATLKSIFVLVDPEKGAQLAGQWGTRETFVAVVTTNLPMIFPLFRNWLKPFFGSVMTSSKKTGYKAPSGFQHISGGDASRARRTTSNAIASNITFTESEERMMHDVKLQTLNGNGVKQPVDSRHIVVSNKIEISTEVSEDKVSQNSDRENQPRRFHEPW